MWTKLVLKCPIEVTHVVHVCCYSGGNIEAIWEIVEQFILAFTNLFGEFLKHFTKLHEKPLIFCILNHLNTQDWLIVDSCVLSNIFDILELMSRKTARTLGTFITSIEHMFQGICF